MSSLTSTLKNLLGSFFSFNSLGTRRIELNIRNGSSGSSDLRGDNKLNVKLCREIYRNTNNKYALSGQLVRPIINNNVNFIGEPKIFGNKKALKILEEIKFEYRRVHKVLEIDGNVAVWPKWDIKKQEIVIELIPITALKATFIDPLSKEVTGYRFEENITYSSVNSNSESATITHIITADVHKTTVVGSALNSSKTVANPFNMLPVVLFTNDRLGNELIGHSELEAIEPQLQLYHDLTYEAAAAQKRDGHPKLKLVTKNMTSWLSNNFGAGTVAKVQGGTETLSLDNRDFFVNGPDDSIDYIYLNKTSGDFKALSETTFTNIVEGSETPEINFGANLGTSLASVKEYRPIWIKKIAAKQAERGESWVELYKLIIMIHNFVNLASVKADDLEIVWEKPNFVSTKEQSEIISSVANAMSKLKNDGVLTDEEVYDTLKELNIVQLAETFKEHEIEIKRTQDEKDERQAKLDEVKAKMDTDSNTDEDSEGDDSSKDNKVNGKDESKETE